MKDFRSGFAALLGWTNVGKSTLLNRIIEQKIVITSPKVQTTRYATVVIFSGKKGQIIFWDTPGFHVRKHLLNERMMRESARALENSDLAIHMVSPDVEADEKPITDLLREFRGPVILAVNKIDIIDKNALIGYMARYEKAGLYNDIIPLSAATGENLDRFLDVCLAHLPRGEKLFPEEDLSDRNARFFMAEIIREKLIIMTRQELPYVTAVVVEDSKWKKDKGIWHIKAVIYVEKDTQKGIVIGKKGEMLRKIGEMARRGLEDFLQEKVYLELWVKVRKNWTRDARFLEEIGYSRRG